MVNFEADEAEEARLKLLSAAPMAASSPVLSLVLLEAAVLVEGVIGVLGVAVLLFDVDGRGVLPGAAAFLKKPSRLDCFPAGLLMVQCCSAGGPAACWCAVETRPGMNVVAALIEEPLYADSEGCMERHSSAAPKRKKDLQRNAQLSGALLMPDKPSTAVGLALTFTRWM